MFVGVITAKPSFKSGRIYIRIKEQNRDEFTYSITSDKAHLTHALSIGDVVEFNFQNRIYEGKNQETNYPYLASIQKHNYE